MIHSRKLIGLLLIGPLFLLTSCGSPSVGQQTGKSNQDFKSTLDASAKISCNTAVLDGYVTCTFPIRILSTAASPKTLDGTFYAVVSGKIFKSDNSLPGEIQSISESWNPGESKAAIVGFNVPSNSVISAVLLGPEGIANVDAAILIIPVNVTAVDGWTPASNYASKISGLVTRLRNSTHYGWVTFTSLDLNDKSLTNLGNGSELPRCWASVFGDTDNQHFSKSYVGVVPEKRYFDSVSGLYIALTIFGPDAEKYATGITGFATGGAVDRYCEGLFTKTEGIKELP